MPVAYRPGVALLLALGSVALALQLVRRDPATPAVLFAGTLLGLGFAGVHYTTMAALATAAVQRYAPAPVAGSVVLSAAAGAAVLWLAFRVHRPSRISLAAAGLGAAICAIQYTALSSLRLAPDPAIPLSGVTTVPGDMLAVVILGVAVSFLTVTLLYYLSADLGEIA